MVINQDLAAEYEQMYGDIGSGFPAYERAPSEHSYRWIRDVLIDIDFETMVAIAEATQKAGSNRKSIIIGFHTEKNCVSNMIATNGSFQSSTKAFCGARIICGDTGISP